MKFSKKYPIIFFPLFAILLIINGITLFSCKKEENKISSDIVFPDSLVSFVHHVEPLFQQTCLFSGCHSGNQPAGGLRLENTLEKRMWNVLVDPGLNLIIVNSGNESRLVKYLDGRLQPQMPLRSTLTINQINGVKKWIDEGASPF